MTKSTSIRFMLLGAALCLTFAGCRPPSNGSIIVSGRYPEASAVRQAVIASELFIVAQSVDDMSMMSVQQVSRDTCWPDWRACPHSDTLSNLPQGQYKISMQIRDRIYQDTRGAKGTATVIGYYTDSPARGDSSVNITDPARAAVLTIDARTHTRTIMLNIR